MNGDQLSTVLVLLYATSQQHPLPPFLPRPAVMPSADWPAG